MNTSQTKETEKPDDRGLRCRRCGRRHFRVIYTRPASGRKVVRRRECRNCGNRITTWERTIGSWGNKQLDATASL
jgi:DNA-directed RNA polymerase subunit RPC12/RpoP